MEAIEKRFSYKPFHSDKVLVQFQDPEIAKLILCKNKGWSTVGNFFVKFEIWSPLSHARPRLVPSYGGWTKFRGIPHHLWNIRLPLK